MFFTTCKSQKFALKLIAYYEEKPVLWDYHHPQYYNKILKNEAWEEIAVKMEVDAEICKRKMNSVLAAYRRERAKERKSAAATKGADKIYEFRSSWYAYEKLKSFLLKKEPVPFKNIITPGVDVEILEESEIDEPNTGICSSTLPQGTSIIRELEDLSDKTFGAVTSSSMINDECQDFANMVAKKIRKFDNITKSIVQNNIMGVILQAEMILNARSSTHFSQRWHNGTFSSPPCNFKGGPL